MNGTANKLFSLLSAVLFQCSAAAEDASAPTRWNQFRGPNGSGVAPACHPPIEIEEEHRAWKTPVPPGLSSPVLSKDRIFLTAHEDDQLLTLAFDKATGKELWRRPAPRQPIERVHAAGSPAASTPWADETRVVVYFGSFGLLCYDHEGEGNMAWHGGIYRIDLDLSRVPHVWMPHDIT